MVSVFLDVVRLACQQIRSVTLRTWDMWWAVAGIHVWMLSVSGEQSHLHDTYQFSVDFQCLMQLGRDSAVWRSWYVRLLQEGEPDLQCWRESCTGHVQLWGEQEERAEDSWRHAKAGAEHSWGWWGRVWRTCRPWHASRGFVMISWELDAAKDLDIAWHFIPGHMSKLLPNVS